MARLSSRIAAAVLIFPLGLALAGCGRSAEGGGPQGAQGLPVVVHVAQLQRVGEATEYIATLRSRDASILQPEVEGQITRIFVRAGQKVARGTPLIEIDPRKQQASVTSQEAARRARVAAVDWYGADLERKKKLYAEGVTSRQDLESAQAAYDAAKSQLDSIDADIRQQQVQLRYYTVTAPAAGVLGDVPVRIGDRVTTSTILTTIDTGGDLEAYISVPAEKAADVRVGTTVEVLGPDDTVLQRAKVNFVSPRVDPDSQLLLIKAPVPNADRRFRNDQLVHARVLWREVERPLIPITAVARLSGQSFAYVAAPGEKGGTVARQRSLKLGEVIGNDYVVLEGINAGDKVIVSGVQMLADGMPVVPQS